MFDRVRNLKVRGKRRAFVERAGQSLTDAMVAMFRFDSGLNPWFGVWDKNWRDRYSRTPQYLERMPAVYNFDVDKKKFAN